MYKVELKQEIFLLIQIDLMNHVQIELIGMMIG
jgi:hypothetical protein